MVSIARVLLPILVAAAIAASLPAAAETQLRMLGQFLPTAKQYPVEKAILDAIDADEGLDIQVIPNVYKAMGLKTSDGLRLVRAGTFHVVAIQIGTASRDDAFLEGIDLIGVSTDMDSLRQAVDAYRDVLDARLQEKFNAKALAIWPFGPQVFYCNQEINSVADLKGLKVRSFTPSMAGIARRDRRDVDLWRGLSRPPAQGRELRRDIAHVGKYRQMARGHHAPDTAVGLGVGAGVFCQSRLVERPFRRSAHRSPGCFQVVGRRLVGYRHRPQCGRDRVQHRAGRLHAPPEVFHETRRGQRR
jgi:hypothetical protein